MPSLVVIVTGPHASLAVAVPNAALISLASGLHPNGALFPPVVIAGGVTSTVHVTVLDVVAVFVHPSVAVNVLVCVRVHPSITTNPSLELITGLLQKSVAVAVPRAFVMSLASGLHPNGTVV